MTRNLKRQSFSHFIKTLFFLDVLFTVIIYIKTKNYKLIIYVGIILTVLMLIMIVSCWCYRMLEVVDSGINAVDNMKIEEFEDFLMNHFISLGYKIEDVFILDNCSAGIIVSKGPRRKVIQANHSKKNIGIEALKQIIKILKFYQTKNGIIITNSYFRPNIKSIAISKGIELWDRDKLVKVMKKNNGKKLASEIMKRKKKNKETEGYITEKKCPVCGGKLIVRANENGEFYECLNDLDFKIKK